MANGKPVKPDGLNEFLNPKSMVTPGVAGALTMAITNSLFVNFGGSRAWIGVLVSSLFALLTVAATAMSIWQRCIFFILNTLIIFTMALGSNSAGNAISSPPLTPPAGAFSTFIPSLFHIRTASGQPSFADGTPIKGSTDPVFIMVHGQKRWIPNPQTFDALGLKWDEILVVPNQVIDPIARGPDYPSLRGPVVKGSGPNVYLLQRGVRRWIPDPETFEAIGLRWESIQLLPDAELQLIPEGPPIPQQKRFFAPWLQRK
jgi:hypothetical protein